METKDGNGMYDSQNMDLIQMMLDISESENLQCEVISAFAFALKNSRASIEEAINFALIEWDLI
jgi:hypothetical protein